MKEKMTNWVSKILLFQDINDVFNIISKHTVTQTYFLAGSIYEYSENYYFKETAFFVVVSYNPTCV